jgi:hypothetical protein
MKIDFLANLDVYENSVTNFSGKLVLITKLMHNFFIL